MVPSLVAAAPALFWASIQRAGASISSHYQSCDGIVLHVPEEYGEGWNEIQVFGVDLVPKVGALG